MFAEGKTTIRDAKELRYKESDRISLLLDNMKKFNPNIGLTEFEDGFEIIPSKNHDNDSVDLETGGDHRIIMSFVIAALVKGKKINFDELFQDNRNNTIKITEDIENYIEALCKFNIKLFSINIFKLRLFFIIKFYFIYFLYLLNRNRVGFFISILTNNKNYIAQFFNFSKKLIIDNI